MKRQFFQADHCFGSQRKNCRFIIWYCPDSCEKYLPAVVHCGQSRALLLRRRGRVNKYTPPPYSSQNPTLTHTASTGCKPPRSARLDKLLIKNKKICRRVLLQGAAHAARSAGCGKTCAFTSLGARENRNAPLSVGFGNCQTRFDCNRWMDCGGRSGFATSTQQECTMYSTVAAQEQGARLPASRHRRFDV